MNRLIGITQGGDAFEFAVNVLNGSELAGACFSPSGKTLFFNLFGRARFDEDPVGGHDRHRSPGPGGAGRCDPPSARSRLCRE